VSETGITSGCSTPEGVSVSITRPRRHQSPGLCPLLNARGRLCLDHVGPSAGRSRIGHLLNARGRLCLDHISAQRPVSGEIGAAQRPRASLSRSRCRSGRGPWSGSAAQRPRASLSRSRRRSERVAL